MRLSTPMWDLLQSVKRFGAISIHVVRRDTVQALVRRGLVTIEDGRLQITKAGREAK